MFNFWLCTMCIVFVLQSNSLMCVCNKFIKLCKYSKQILILTVFKILKQYIVNSVLLLNFNEIDKHT